MSGLDNIVNEIRANAKKEADDILKEADDYCEEYMNGVKAQVEKEVEKYNKKAEEARKLYKEKTISSAAFDERNAILKAKQQCIDQVIKEAMSNIKGLSDDEYFGLLTKLFEKNVQPESGIMYISKNDDERITSDFKNKIQNIAEKNNGSITIKSDRSDVTDGFVLVYGDIEQNCKIKALFDANIDKLKDIANKKMFG